MYTIAFRGDISLPLLYSYDRAKWYKPNGEIYKTMQINDRNMVPGRNYNKEATPDQTYTLVRIQEGEGAILICQNGNVELLIQNGDVEESIIGLGYMKDFQMPCPIPIGIKDNVMIFIEPKVIYNDGLIEYPFFSEENNVLISDEVDYESIKDGNINLVRDNKYNDDIPRYKIGEKNLYMDCDDDEIDYFKKVRMTCMPINGNTLFSKFPGSKKFIINGIYGHLVVVYDDYIEVHQLKYYSGYSYVGIGHYELGDTLIEWDEYYNRRLLETSYNDIDEDVGTDVEDLQEIIRENKLDRNMLMELADRYNVSYISLLLYIWFNFDNILVEKISRWHGTDSNDYIKTYNKKGEFVKEELSSLLRGSSWRYEGYDIYDIEDDNRNGKSEIIINKDESTYIIESDDSFEPRITIAGAIKEGDNMYSITELPYPISSVSVREI
ncbi:Hypothetical protein ORPV_201 [Orpheovirus IHUMI-LCC2]|uniref:Uncharacterized protein n=1 Tax=Orpheovirus IHUMI-LCC2 TaxID=2023057 RepID=A0A2I2L3I2_9VIRU|nr:Hypothetical protein ORPV_201 [Orpheovirus IHUMI-LCC2]SNW62105.1 Hypothetical protein ORPV_201 [Orpheovirus IHUMI-LCC2]